MVSSDAGSATRCTTRRARRRRRRALVGRLPPGRPRRAPPRSDRTPRPPRRRRPRPGDTSRTDRTGTSPGGTSPLRCTPNHNPRRTRREQSEPLDTRHDCGDRPDDGRLRRISCRDYRGDVNRVGVRNCALAALLFGASTPAASVVAQDMRPLALAGLLYLGAALAVSPWWIVRRPTAGALARDWRPLAVAIVAGGAVGPALLTAGLVDTPAATASLLLNMEMVATVILAATLFREHLGRNMIAAASLVTFAGLLLVWEPGATINLQALLIVGGVRVLGAGQQRHVRHRPDQPATRRVPQGRRGRQRQPRVGSGPDRDRISHGLDGSRCSDDRCVRVRSVDHVVGTRSTTARSRSRAGDLRDGAVRGCCAVVGRARPTPSRSCRWWRC